MKKQKGFTIVELLAVVLILSLLSITLVSYYGNTVDKIKEEENVSIDVTLKQAVSVLYNLKLNNNTLKYFEKDGKFITCFDINTLVKEGYLTEEEGKEVGTAYVYVTIKDGQIENPTKTNNKTVCEYTEVGLAGGLKTSTPTTAENYKLTQNLVMTDSNTFRVDMDLSFQVAGGSITTSHKDTYVMMVVDKSLSMKGSKLNAANSAVTKLFQTLANKNNTPGLPYRFCTALISSYAYLITGTWSPTVDVHTLFRTTAFNSPIPTSILDAWWSNYVGPFSKARELFFQTSNNYVSSACNQSKSANVNKVIIFMADGEPNLPAWPFGNKTDYKPIVNDLKSSSKGVSIWSIGYDVDANHRSLLEEIASVNCGLKNNLRCYFDSNESGIAPLLETLANNIIDDTFESNVKTAELSLKLNTDYFGFVSAKNLDAIAFLPPSTITVKIDMSNYDFATGMFNTKALDYAFNLKYNGKEVSTEIPLFKEAKIIFRDAFGDQTDQKVISNIPKISFNTKKALAIN